MRKIRDFVDNGTVIDVGPEFRAIHRTAPFRNLQLRMLPVYKKAVAEMHKVLLFHVEDIPPLIYERMHTANEYHWRPREERSRAARYLIAQIAPPEKLRSTLKQEKSSASRDTRRYACQRSMK